MGDAAQYRRPVGRYVDKRRVLHLRRALDGLRLQFLYGARGHHHWQRLVFLTGPGVVAGSRDRHHGLHDLSRALWYSRFATPQFLQLDYPVGVRDRGPDPHRGRRFGALPDGRHPHLQRPQGRLHHSRRSDPGRHALPRSRDDGQGPTRVDHSLWRDLRAVGVLRLQTRVRELQGIRWWLGTLHRGTGLYLRALRSRLDGVRQRLHPLRGARREQGFDRRLDVPRYGDSRDLHDGAGRGYVYVCLLECTVGGLERIEPLRGTAHPAHHSELGRRAVLDLRDRAALRHQLTGPLLLGRVAPGHGTQAQALPGRGVGQLPRLRPDDLGDVPVDVLALHEGVRRRHHRVDRPVARHLFDGLDHAQVPLQRLRTPAQRQERDLLRRQDRRELELNCRLRRGHGVLDDRLFQGAAAGELPVPLDDTDIESLRRSVRGQPRAQCLHRRLVRRRGLLGADRHHRGRVGVFRAREAHGQRGSTGRETTRTRTDVIVLLQRPRASARGRCLFRA